MKAGANASPGGRASGPREPSHKQTRSVHTMLFRACSQNAALKKSSSPSSLSSSSSSSSQWQGTQSRCPPLNGAPSPFPFSLWSYTAPSGKAPSAAARHRHGSGTSTSLRSPLRCSSPAPLAAAHRHSRRSRSSPPTAARRTPRLHATTPPRPTLPIAPTKTRLRPPTAPEARHRRSIPLTSSCRRNASSHRHHVCC